MTGDEDHPRAYGRRFVLFQLSKYVWAATAVLAFVATWACIRSTLPVALAMAVVTATTGFLAFRMTNSYRCPNAACNQILIFAHGSSGTGGPSSRVDKCPFCGVRLL